MITFADLQKDGEVYFSRERDGSWTIHPRLGFEQEFDRFVASLQDMTVRDFALFPRLDENKLYDCAEIIPV
ncbi:hypothetical protein U0030_00990 [Brevundimonas bullata]|jgi:hypothetical protein|uniref:hypothetical protein n=1 Tax=Brevundimonas bullata TaxID=13160 RepID=UPI000E0A4F5B|nr:hypothetical protein [Brevundimonas bullata]WQE37075.1 hypothetical protein U0030_00990 [Brevundimonas bullata]